MSRRTGSPVGGLARYASAAILVRAADGGAAVGLILLALDPQLKIHGGAAVGGLLAAALTAPHLLAPWAGDRLDRARDGRGLLATSYLGYAAALALGALMLGNAPLAAPLAAVTVAGLCGPLLTGGLSSRLPAIAGPGTREQRRAQGLDALTYGVGGTLGPIAVAGLSAVAGARLAVLGLCAATVAASALTLTLPARARPTPAELDQPDMAKTTTGQRVRAGLRPLIADPPLRRVSLLTLVGALGTGGLPVITATLGLHLSHRAAAGAVLITALGVGSLLGSLLVMLFPLSGEPEVLAIRHFAALVAVTAGCALAPTFFWALIGFGLLGILQATFFTTTLAARAQYSPPAVRAQVFVTSAGLKVAVSSLGAAVLGLSARFAGGRVLLLSVAAVTGLGLMGALLDRLIGLRPRAPGPDARASAPPPLPGG